MPAAIGMGIAKAITANNSTTVDDGPRTNGYAMANRDVTVQVHAGAQHRIVTHHRASINAYIGCNADTRLNHHMGANGCRRIDIR